MASTWNGSALRTRYAQKYGFTDTTSLARVLEWMCDIQNDIAASHSWPFLKFKMKKFVAADSQEFDISPDVPSAPVITRTAGGSLTDASAVTVKVTFLIFDSTGTEINSIESEPSSASNSITTTTGEQSLSIASIPTYSGSASVTPSTIHRRIYVKVGSDPYYYSQTITDNTTTTATVTINPSSVVEPPEYSLVSCMAGEDPIIEGSGMAISEVALDNILKTDPGLTATGTPQYYARISPTKIILYPRPSSSYTLSYWIYRIPCRIFADTDRPIQLYHGLKEVLDAGLTWKFYEFKDQDGQESKKINYEQRKADAKGVVGRSGGQAMAVKAVC